MSDGFQHLISCPSGSVLSSLGCGTSQCCTPSTGVCIPDLYGPCVCFDYNGPTGANFTFIGSCGVGGAVSGVANVTSCTSAPAAANGRDSCYCRFAIAGHDIGMLGDVMPGNWILGPKGECLVFDKNQPGAVSASASPGARMDGGGLAGVLGLLACLWSLF